MVETRHFALGPEKYLPLQTKIFKEIFDSEINKNPKNNERTTPFHLATRYGHFQIFNFYIENLTELNIDLNSSYGGDWKTVFSMTNFMNPLQWACHYDQMKIVEILVKNSTEYNIDLNAKSA